jgi:hypothetical protein
MLDPFVSAGEKGAPVIDLQANGVFDTETETAVKGFQDMQVGLVEPIPVTRGRRSEDLEQAADAVAVGRGARVAAGS